MDRRAIFWSTLALIILCIVMAGCTTPPAPVPVSPTSWADRPAAPEHVAKETAHATPAEMPKPAMSWPTEMSVHRFPYVLNGDQGTVSVALSDKVYADYVQKPDPPWEGENAQGNITYFRTYVNDPEQQPYIAALARAIQEKTPDRDNQARIAVSLVQHIPYMDDSEQYRFPYEVLYTNRGVCGEKSMLLALLLKDLGYGSAVLYFLPEDHMVAGISAPAPYDFRNSGYAFIEATEPYIITDSETDNLAQYSLTKTMEITPVGTGAVLSTVVSDATDAKEWAVIEGKGDNISPDEYSSWQSLNIKYDLSYYTNN